MLFWHGSCLQWGMSERCYTAISCRGRQNMCWYTSALEENISKKGNWSHSNFLWYQNVLLFAVSKFKRLIGDNFFITIHRRRFKQTTHEIHSYTRDIMLFMSLVIPISACKQWEQKIYHVSLLLVKMEDHSHWFVHVWNTVPKYP